MDLSFRATPAGAAAAAGEDAPPREVRTAPPASDAAAALAARVLAALEGDDDDDDDDDDNGNAVSAPAGAGAGAPRGPAKRARSSRGAQPLRKKTKSRRAGSLPLSQPPPLPPLLPAAAASALEPGVAGASSAPGAAADVAAGAAAGDSGGGGGAAARDAALAGGEDAFVHRATLRAVAGASAVLAQLAGPPLSGGCRALRAGPAAVLPAASASAGALAPPGARPCARWGAAAAMLDDRLMLLYGGHSALAGCDVDGELDSSGAGAGGGGGGGGGGGRGASPSPLADSWVLDTRDGTWSEASCAAAPARAWHALVPVPGRSWALSFGEVGGAAGAGGAGGGGAPAAAASAPAAASDDPLAAGAEYEEVSVLDADVGVCYAPALTGRLPGRRAGSAVALVPLAVVPGAGAATRAPEPAVVVFGGRRAGAGPKGRTTWTNDVFAWPVGPREGHGRWHWTSLGTRADGRQPPPRAAAAVAALGSRLVVVGGTNGESTFGDVAYLQCAPTAASKDVWSWHWPKVKGGGPRARSGAVALPIGDRFVLLLGGWDREEPAAGAASASGGGGGGGGGRGGGCSARGASARGGAGAASAPPAPSPLEAEDASRPRGDPFPEAWLLDTGAPDASGGGGGEWEWLRVDFGGEPPAPDAGPAARAGYAAGVRLALGRAGHTAVFVPDVSGLLRAAAGGAPQTLSASPAEASLAAPAQPGVVIFGGRLGGGALSNDVVVLPLPRALVEAASARSAAAAAAAAEFAELAAQAAAARAASPVFDGQDEEEEPEGARGGGGGGGVGGGGGPSSFAPAPAPASAPELAPAADDDDDGWGAVLAQPNPTQ